MDTLDRHLPQFDLNEVHQISLDLSPHDAIDRVLDMPVTSDWIVRTLFRVRGLSGLDLSIEDFATRESGLEIVERTLTTVVATGKQRGQPVGTYFEAVANPDGGLHPLHRDPCCRSGSRVQAVLAGGRSVLGVDPTALASGGGNEAG